MMTQSNFLFLGDSLIADFDWQARMHHFKILNYGVPGETAQGLRNRIPSMTKDLENREIAAARLEKQLAEAKRDIVERGELQL